MKRLAQIPASNQAHQAHSQASRVIKALATPARQESMNMFTSPQALS